MRIFHHRKRNQIESLCNDEGAWVTDQADMKSMAINYFDNIYEESIAHCNQYSQSDCFPHPDQNLLEEVAVPFSSEQVRSALFAMWPWKAPGVDSLQAGFYRSNWYVVGADVSS